MTADYTHVAAYDIRSFIWNQLQNAGILTAGNYTATGFTQPLVPIIPAQQVPEFNNLLPGKTYIIYDVAIKRGNVQWWVSQETMTFEITSRATSEIQTIINFLIDLFRRYDKSAIDVNFSLDPNSPFSFLWLNVESADPIQAFQNEGGFMTGMLTIHYAYTREVDGTTGKFL
jgi:hypothetical protein